MDLSMQRTTEIFPYRHKKFDAYKRARDEDIELEAMERRTPHFVFNPLFFGAERVTTPFSTDSNCSTEYAGFVSLFNASSTPSSKRRCLLTGTAQNMSSPSEDSGISLTPQKTTKKAQQTQKGLKRLLKQSALAAPFAKKARIETESREVLATNNIIVDATLKRRKVESSGKTPKQPAMPTAQPCNGIKAALKPALKPTPAGTLELTTATTPSNALPPAAATVLARISEDKLRSICTYHGNMVRQFPKKQRSPKDQERRNKNTIACRMSRRLKKLEHIAVEVQLKEHERQFGLLMEQRLRIQTYMEQLTLLSSVLCKREMLEEDVEIDVVNLHDDVRGKALKNAANFRNSEAAQAQKQSMAVGSTLSTALSSAYSIAYLMGSLRK